MVRPDEFPLEVWKVYGGLIGGGMRFSDMRKMLSRSVGLGLTTPNS